MEFQKTITLGYTILNPNSSIHLAYAADGDRLKYFSSKRNIVGRSLLALMQFLQQHKKHFDRMNVVLNYEQSIFWRNGTWSGIIGKINHSEVDVGVAPFFMNERNSEAVDFVYPYKLLDFTFVTRKPEYKPHISGIFQMFSLPVWLTIISVLIAMALVSYALLKRRYTSSKIFLDVFAILMRQNSCIKLSSLAEKLLVYSWVVGAMLLCLSYESVFLSFLSIPPVTKIKHLSDLALAIERGDYHCISNYPKFIHNRWMTLKPEYLKIIATDIVQNKLSYGDPIKNFIRESKKQNLAYVIETMYTDILPVKIFFISEDRFHERMYGMVVRRGFCCKELIDSFVHKMMASGLYMKYFSDLSFLSSMELKSFFPVYGTTNRKLTLTDVAPAFIFLISGYFISFLALIVEMVLDRKKMNSIKINQKKKRRQKRGNVSDETPV